MARGTARSLATAAFFAMIVSASVAFGQSPDSGGGAPKVPESPRFQNRYFGFVFTALQYTGFGGGIRAGTHRIGLAATATSQTVFAWSDQLELLNTLQLNLDPYVLFGESTSRFRLGFTLGYKNNTTLRHGFAGGFYGLLNIREDIAAQIQLGLAYYPDAESEVLRAINTCATPDDPLGRVCGKTLGFDPGIQPGLSLALLLFP